MSEVLLNHINRYVELDEGIAQEIAAFFSTLKLQKRQVILEEGSVCNQLFFVSKGCLRLYYLDDKGVEQTIQFALETWWMTDIDAFNKKGKSSYSIQALENSEVVAISKDDWTLLLEKFPELEKYFRQIYERAYAASLFRIKLFRLSKEEFYHLFRDSYPGFIQRIPQKILASFLGFTPEYLSELRKKNESK
ncbi:Crp/Fnr family transcriptional regulator [Flavobacterium azooxidireducens]|uniref:Crp/Fnr family transcriptional regulator n=1 Tax=Flavobacterium azooxidireducens TaxID=1871076 RepID=A0ABY4KBQ0_9FLAO|nr:Crp/Fnr family transcriptional regulator [Flavobacterium azooxidireducens]UPQ77999.1 Crp/Fnr family transcriptional regulator [Flavobacterium azooxidireducens]